jgi:hypothetical protein
MIILKQQYDTAKQKAIELMNKGLIKEYIAQLNLANNLRVALIKYNN